MKGHKISDDEGVRPICTTIGTFGWGLKLLVLVYSDSNEYSLTTLIVRFWNWFSLLTCLLTCL